MPGLISSTCYPLLFKHSCKDPCALYQYLKIDFTGKTVCTSTGKRKTILEGSSKYMQCIESTQLSWCLIGIRQLPFYKFWCVVRSVGLSMKLLWPGLWLWFLFGEFTVAQTRLNYTWVLPPGQPDGETGTHGNVGMSVCGCRIPSPIAPMHVYLWGSFIASSFCKIKYKI